MTPMTDLPALREAVAKMTPGPWKADGIDISPIMSTGDFTPCELKRCEDAAGIVALRDAAPALLDEVETLRQRVNEDNEVCLCGCPPDAHECYEEDGESCENETHTCLRVCRSVAAEFEASQKALSAERIENAHLREAFVTMEKAYNSLALRTCETCRHQRANSVDYYPYCGHVPISCATVNFTCGAWAAKEQP